MPQINQAKIFEALLAQNFNVAGRKVIYKLLRLLPITKGRKLCLQPFVFTTYIARPVRFESSKGGFRLAPQPAAYGFEEQES